MATIYPNEAFPADQAVLSLDGTLDAETGLPYVAKGVGPNSSPSYEIHYNRRLWRQNRILAALRGGMVVDEGSLAIGVYPVDYTLGGVRKRFDGATAQAVPDDSTRKVYLDANNALNIAESFPADLAAFLPLATVVTVSGGMTISDERPATLFEVSPVGATVRNLPFAPSVFLGGELSVKVWEIEWVAPVAFTLVDATGRVATAPTGTSLIVDVRDAGTSIFASDADRINIASGTKQDTSATVDHAVDAGDVLTFEVKQVGSTQAGRDLTVVLNGRAGIQV